MHGDIRSLSRTLVVTTAIGLAGTPVLAQEPNLENVLVARYSLDAGALDEVSNSAELIAALRDHLTAEARMPLDEPLRVDLMGEVRDPIGGGAYPFAYSGLGFEVMADGAESDLLRSAVQTAHGPDSPYDDDEWNEEAAWDWLLWAVEEGLTTSLAADGSFNTDGEGRVPLRVANVHMVSFDDWDTEDGLERVYLKLQPGARFASSSDGNWSEPPGFGHDIQVLLLEIEPGPAPELSAAKVSAETLGRLAGTYEPGPGGAFDVRVEGEGLVGTIRRADREDVELLLVPVSDSDFNADYEGRRFRFSFAVEPDGNATEVTVEQAGMIQAWPRVN